MFLAAFLFIFSAATPSPIVPVSAQKAWAQSQPAAAKPAAEANVPDNAVIGGGSHFAWTIISELKTDIEKRIGRPVTLYGEDYAMYGVGCNAGIKIARSNSPGMETFGFVCCPLSEEEVNKNQLTVHPLAWEPIYIIVHESNPIESLTLDQVRGIFKGEILNWREVGGPDKSILVITRNHCKDRPGHWKTIIPNVKDFREDRMNVGSAELMVRSMSDFSNAIGHVGSGWSFTSADKIKIIKVNGFEPNPANLKSKKYPFFRLLSIITHGPVSAAIRDVVDFMKESEEFKRVAEQYNMLPVER